MAALRVGWSILVLSLAACDFGIDTKGLAGDGSALLDVASDVSGDGGAEAPDDVTQPSEGGNETGPASLFGDTSIEGTQDNVSSGDPDGFRYQAGTGGSAQTVWVYVDGQTSGASFDVGIYDDDATQSPATPKGLLAFSTFTSVTPGAWNSQPLSSSITITAGSFYWIVLRPSSSTVYYRNAGGSTGTPESVSTTALSLPTTWTTAQTANDGPASMYVAP